MTDELILMLAAASSEEDLVGMLKKEILEYESIKDSETSDAQKAEIFEKIQVTCIVVMSKKMVPTLGDVAKVAKEMKAKKEMIQFLSGDSKNNLN